MLTVNQFISILLLMIFPLVVFLLPPFPWIYQKTKTKSLHQFIFSLLMIFIGVLSSLFIRITNCPKSICCISIAKPTKMLLRNTGTNGAYPQKENSKTPFLLKS
ncbi:uncharacterized protein B0P05DRAFT_521287 [Gilbertella persicaria]|uniref:uncharacterized protein n=1 Tax=Gilbertella persicaria TaxID=101096 RepID=UPI00221E7448|nr:uncharacterized protein B0P05DRAFT_521287 [Gilbertella persicaria]KAI8098297.1 hypothetical protein B0P05DRAFT_521287 [Gilbertella persicaria]